jgi:peptidoglycan/xylan/chitin deacetylase (PgdA/CDA1 family)
MAVEGMEIGSHTRTHFNCGSTEREALEREIAGSRRDLEALVGEAIPFFSFPWGRPANMSGPAVEIAGKSYKHFFSAYGGVNFPGKLGPHLVRSAHPHSLWELELTLQQLLEMPRSDAVKLHALYGGTTGVQS